jgi:hypothetical protein
MTGWISALALAGFLISLGQFLDKYHISLKTKDKARLLLVRGFVFLDGISIPDVPRAIFMVTLRPHERLSATFCLLLYMANLLVVLAAIFGVMNISWEFALGIMLTVVVFIAVFPHEDWWAKINLIDFFAFFFVGIPLASFLILRFVFKRGYDHKWRFVRILSTPLTIISIVVAQAAALYVAYISGNLDDYVTPGLVVGFTAPVILLILLVVMAMIVKAIVQLIRKVTLLMFQAASEPQMSPFSYAAALMGILVLGVKLVWGDG